MENINKNLKIYFIGIGGVGMSSLALYLLKKGFVVYGSDVSKNEQTKILEENGIKIDYIDNFLSVEKSDIVVYTSAVKSNNTQLNLAKKLNKPTYKRSQLLGLIISSFKNSIGVSGSHGKTTITSIVTHILYTANKSFTAFIGGCDYYFNNLYTDGKKHLVLSEVCEYDKAIYDVNVLIGICSNIDDDHLDCYYNIENVKKAFFSFLDRSQYKIICNDNKYLKEYKGENVITYGIENESVVMAKNVTNLIGKYSFDLIINNKNYGRINLNSFGKYSVYNTLCAVATCYLMKISINTIIKGLASFKGVERRFEYLGKIYKKSVISDYAHHPTEIKNAITTAKQVFKDNLLIIFEPHTYSRTKLLYEDFIKVFLNENVYFYKTFPAREDYLYLGSSQKLSTDLNKKYYESFDKLLLAVKKSNFQNVLVLGAGELYCKFKEQINK